MPITQARVMAMLMRQRALLTHADALAALCEELRPLVPDASHCATRTPDPIAAKLLTTLADRIWYLADLAAAVPYTTQDRVELACDERHYRINAARNDKRRFQARAARGDAAPSAHASRPDETTEPDNGYAEWKAAALRASPEPVPALRAEPDVDIADIPITPRDLTPLDDLYLAGKITPAEYERRSAQACAGALPL